MSLSGGINKRPRFSYSGRVKAVGRQAFRATCIFNTYLTFVLRKVHTDQEYVLILYAPSPLSDRKRPPEFQLKYAYREWARERSSWKVVM